MKTWEIVVINTGRSLDEFQADYISEKHESGGIVAVIAWQKGEGILRVICLDTGQQVRPKKGE